MSAAEMVLILVGAGDVGGAAGLGAWLWYLRPTAVAARSKARRTEEARLTAGIQAVKDLPDRPLDGSWRPALPGETPGTVEPDDAPAPVWTAGTDEGRHHYPDEIHAPRHQHQARHAAEGVRDRRRRGWRRDTEVFEAIVEHETGSRPLQHGPREATFRGRIQWQDQPPLWTQTELEVS